MLQARYFQVRPYHMKRFTSHSRLTANGTPLRWLEDWVAIPGARAPRIFVNADVIFGGVTGDTTSQITAAQAAGKVVVLLPAPLRPAPSAPGGGGVGAFGGPPNRFADAAAVATVDLDALTAAQRSALAAPTIATSNALGGRGTPARKQA